MNVFLNPGHAPNGEPDPGAVNTETGLREAEVAADVAYLVCGYLHDAGVDGQVYQSDSLEDICETANASGADIFVSIHCNSADSPAAQGTETFCYPGSDAGASLAGCIQRQIVDSMDTVDRGVKEAVPGRNGLYVISNTDCPAVLVELAFISNEDDERLLADRRNDFAQAVARGITDYEQLINN